MKITNFINAAFRLKYVARLRKVAEVIMISKPGKPSHEAALYRPISLLPMMSKLFEKLLIKRLKPIIERKKPMACTRTTLTLSFLLVTTEHPGQ